MAYIPPHRREGQIRSPKSKTPFPPREKQVLPEFEHPNCVFIRADFLPRPKLIQALDDYTKDFCLSHPEESPLFYVSQPHCKCQGNCLCEVIPIRYVAVWIKSKRLAYHMTGYLPNGSKNVKVEVDEDDTWLESKPEILDSVSDENLVASKSDGVMKFDFDWAEFQEASETWEKTEKEHIHYRLEFTQPLRILLTDPEDIEKVLQACEIRKAKGKQIYWDGEYLTLRATRTKIRGLPDSFHQDILRTSTPVSRKELDFIHKLLISVVDKPIRVGRDEKGQAYFHFTERSVIKPEQLSKVQKLENERTPPDYILVNTLFRTISYEGKKIILEAVYATFLLPQTLEFSSKSQKPVSPKNPRPVSPKGPRSPPKASPKIAQPRGNPFSVLDEQTKSPKFRGKK